MAANKIIDSLAVNCGKDVYTYQPDRASKVADKDAETQIQRMEKLLRQKVLLRFGHGGADLNPGQMKRVMQEFNQLEQRCNDSEDPKDKEYLTKAKNKLKDEGFELPPHGPIKKSKLTQQVTSEALARIKTIISELSTARSRGVNPVSVSKQDQHAQNMYKMYKSTEQSYESYMLTEERLKALKNTNKESNTSIPPISSP